MRRRQRERRSGPTSWLVTRDRGASRRRFRGPRARLRRGAAGLRPSLHLLHHPLRPRHQPLGAGGRGRRARRARLVEAGYREIVLTGVDITAYGADLPGAPTLGQLVAAPAGAGAGAGAAAPLLARPDRDRRRAVAPDRRGAAADAASASVAAGRRRPDPEAHEAPASAAPTRSQSPRGARDLRPDIALGADLIAGFPTEDEAMFRQHASTLVEECGLAFLHVFPYSARGRHAGGADAAGAGRRAQGARGAAARRRRGAATRRYFAGRIGAIGQVLIERSEDGMGFGHSEHFAPVAPQERRPRSAAVVAGARSPDAARRMLLAGAA